MKDKGYVIFIKKMLNHNFIVMLYRDKVIKINSSLKNFIYIGDLLRITLHNNYLIEFQRCNHCIFLIDKATLYLPILSISNILMLHITTLDLDESLNKYFELLSIIVENKLSFDSLNEVYFLYISIKYKILVLLGYDFFINNCIVQEKHNCSSIIKYIDLKNQIAICDKMLFGSNQWQVRADWSIVDQDLVLFFSGNGKMVEGNKTMVLKIMQIFDIAFEDRFSKQISLVIGL